MTEKCFYRQEVSFVLWDRRRQTLDHRTRTKWFEGSYSSSLSASGSAGDQTRVGRV